MSHRLRAPIVRAVVSRAFAPSHARKSSSSSICGGGLTPSGASLALAFVALSAHPGAHAQSATADAGSNSKATPQLAPVVVTASPFETRDAGDLTQPVSVLRGDRLREREGSNLGDTLSRELGVTSSAYGAGAGRPIIRGLDSSRVRITESGIGTADVSGASPDHRVAADTFNSDQVEILRGPSSLLYGSGAIGGLVNIVSKRIPLERHDDFEADVRLRGATADLERSGAFGLEAPLSASTMWRLEGFETRTGNYALAKPLRDADGNVVADRRLPNSQTDTHSVALGASTFLSGGAMFGAAVQSYRSDYGIPDPNDPVDIELERTRVDARLDVPMPWAGFEALRVKASYTDYTHREVEGDGAEGARFTNHGVEARFELPHVAVAGWKGVFGAQLGDSQIRGTGEGLLPRTGSTNLALFAVEERRLDAWKFELGARGESQRYSVDEDDAVGARKPSHDFGLFSASGSAFYRLIAGIEAGATVSWSQRAPSADELYFEGAHPATFAYQIGDPNLRKEQSRNLELALRKNEGAVRWKVAVFENKFRDYIYGAFDGSTRDVLDDQGAVEDSLAVLRFRQDNARFRGAEAEASFGESTGFNARVWGDLVRAVLTSGPSDGADLPRISPARLGLDLGYRTASWNVFSSITRTFRQTRVAGFDIRNGEPEQATSGYTVLDVGVNYRVRYGTTDVVYSLQGRNLTDAEARVHTSYLKDLAPLPGRSVIGEVRIAL